MPRHFKMTPEIMDQVIFGMENQNEDMVLDCENALVMPRTAVKADAEGDDPEEERYFDLPRWTPSDGFRVMEGFAGALKNPIYRERLRQILNSGRGVFRGFKNVLKERPDLEKKWFLYKERFMKQRVKEWYTDLCGYWEARDAGEEPVEMDDLFQEEFSIQAAEGRDPDFLKGRQAFFEEIYREAPPNLRKILEHQSNWRGRPADLVLKSLTPEGSFCGMLSAFIDECYDFEGEQAFLFLDALFVLPEFRGAGIASGLMDKAAELCHDKGISRMVSFIPPEGDVMVENLKRKGFNPFCSTMTLDIQGWYYETYSSGK